VNKFEIDVTKKAVCAKNVHFGIAWGFGILLVYFFERSTTILKDQRLGSLITSNKFVKANYDKHLRFFYLNSSWKRLWTLENCLFLTKQLRLRPSILFRFDTVENVVQQSFEYLPEEAFGNDFWSLGHAKVNAILAKMSEVGTPLGEYVDGQMYRGILTGFNQAFIIDEAKKNALIAADPKSAEIIHPFAIGDDIRYYHIRGKKRYIILTKIGIKITCYPAILEHLKKYQKQLEKRWDKGTHWWELRACTYYEFFEKPKIVYLDIAKESRFSLSKDTLYLGNTCYFLPISNKSLLAILNSKLIWFYCSRIAAVLGNAQKGGRLRWFSQDVMKIPIVLKKDKLSKKLDYEVDTSAIAAQIEQLVYALYGLTAEEIQTVAGSI
jgi:hypothetical protein